MFDNPYSFVNWFMFLIAIAFLIYRFQVIMTIIDGFKDWISRKDKYDKQKRKSLELQTELDKTIANKEISKLDNSAVKLELLKIVKSENQYAVYFLVDGGPIYIKSITSRSVNITEIQPEGYIQDKSSAHFVFKNLNSENDSIFLEITFEDQFTVIHKKNYVLSVQDNTFKEMV
ncbi:MAG: hypothetical protein ACK4UV_01540 [Ignavibacterium sp.]